MRPLVIMLMCCAGIASAAQPSVPVEDLGREREQAVQRGQFQAGQAYRDWQDARFDAKLAEQDVLNIEEAYRRSSDEAAQLKQKLDAARKALAAAKARAADRQQAYEQAVDAVERARRAAPVK